MGDTLTDVGEENGILEEFGKQMEEKHIMKWTSRGLVTASTCSPDSRTSQLDGIR